AVTDHLFRVRRRPCFRHPRRFWQDHDNIRPQSRADHNERVYTSQELHLRRNPLKANRICTLAWKENGRSTCPLGAARAHGWRRNSLRRRIPYMQAHERSSTGRSDEETLHDPHGAMHRRRTGTCGGAGGFGANRAAGKRQFPVHLQSHRCGLFAAPWPHPPGIHLRPAPSAPQGGRARLYLMSVPRWRPRSPACRSKTQQSKSSSSRTICRCRAPSSHSPRLPILTNLVCSCPMTPTSTRSPDLLNEALRIVNPAGSRGCKAPLHGNDRRAAEGSIEKNLTIAATTRA